jgi:hypothetical protein
MRYARVPAAKYINRKLSEPYETMLGGVAAHHLLATAFADRVCDPAGHSISWSHCYVSADVLPLPQKARLLLEDMGGKPKDPPAFLTGEARGRAVAAGQLAERVSRLARVLGVD